MVQHEGNWDCLGGGAAAECVREEGDGVMEEEW